MDVECGWGAVIHQYGTFCLSETVQDDNIKLILASGEKSSRPRAPLLWKHSTVFYFVFYHNRIKSLFKASASRNHNKGMAEI